jgi:hypothetical protein
MYLCKKKMLVHQYIGEGRESLEKVSAKGEDDEEITFLQRKGMWHQCIDEEGRWKIFNVSA